MPPFEPDNWVSLGAVLPSRPGSESPTGSWAFFNGKIYLAYAGEYQNLGAGSGYSQATTAKVGSIWKSTDGTTWTISWEGNTGWFGYQRWQPVGLFVIGSWLYAGVIAGGSNWFVNNAYIPKGALGLIRTDDGITWELVTLFEEWAEQNFGAGIPSNFTWNPAISFTFWKARDSGPDGEDAWWLVYGLDVYVNGTGGSFTKSGTWAYRSIDGGATWDLVRDMRGEYPWVTGGSGPGPGLIQAVRRLDQPGYPERWFMFGGTGFANYSDDLGETWLACTFDTNAPAIAFGLNNSGVVAFAHGTGTSMGNTKISCDFGKTYVTRTGSGIILAPANQAFVPVQFGGIEELVVAVRDNIDSSSKTALWYTTDGGEIFTKLGTLATAFFVPYWLAYIPTETPRLVLWTRDLSVWYCEDEPSGETTPRAICPLLFEPLDEPAYMPGSSGVGPPIRVRVDSNPHGVPTTAMREGGYVPNLPRREKPFGA